eukprot:TRINITY_DN37_c0_g1_i1.p2 TRINITY_DN37_c0_g1~~TRINITY_DN37_c0_g1_i1.p2  ORF type:complete len:434 (-),score=96.01 TRINITY_DN37_c0_g1_i1:3967-5268(-)
MAADALLDETLPLVVLRRAAPGPPPSRTSLNASVVWSESNATLTLTLFDLSAELLLLRHVQTASSYPALRAAQSLRVDFAQFAAHLVGLLRRVLSDEAYVAQLHMGVSAERAAIAEGVDAAEVEFHTPSEGVREEAVPDTALLRIVEIATFKVITHIELVMHHASNQLLVTTLAALARGVTSSAQRQRELEASLEDTRRQLQEADARADRVQSLLTDAENKLRENQHELQRCEQLQQVVERSEQRVKELELSDEQFGATAAECERLRAVVDSFTENEGKKEAEIEELKRRVHTVTAQREEACKEIEKGNAIIEKLQNELRSCRARSRVKSKLIAKQEQIVGERDVKINELQRDVVRVRDRAALLQVQKEGVEERLREALGKLEENRAVLQSDQQVIAYLNRELNDRLIGQIGGETVHDVVGGTQELGGAGVAL